MTRTPVIEVHQRDLFHDVTGLGGHCAPHEEPELPFLGGGGGADGYDEPYGES